MATQGIVSIRSKGQMAVKIVAGMNGMFAANVGMDIRAMGRVPTTAEALEIAKRHRFGVTESLVVVTATEILYEGDDEIGPLYRKTFADAQFNPRWDNGTADHVVVIDF